MLSMLSSLDLSLLALIAAFLVPAASAYAGRQRWLQDEIEDKQLLRSYWVLIIRGWLIVAVIAAIWLAQGRSFALLGLRYPPSWPDYVGFAVIGTVLLMLPMQLLRLAQVTRPELADAIRRIEAIKITPDTISELAVFMLVSVTAGVWEELLYRGFLLWYLTPHTGVLGAVIVSSLLFGLGHLYQGPAGVVSTTILGAIFALFYLSSGSLWWVMALHAAIDVQAGLVSFRIKQIAGRRRERAADIAAKLRQRRDF